MPIFRLEPHLLAFPSPHLAEPSGLLAIGGDLRPERLLRAYREGIFPWFEEDTAPPLWWSPDPRFVLFPDNLHIAQRTVRIMRRPPYRITANRCFERVLRTCGTIARPGQDGTWITQEMVAAYIALHELGYAHSIEVWQRDELVGGVYGVAVGKCFFGESMFSTAPNASKLGFIALVRALEQRGFRLIDCQIHSPHLEQWGAEMISRQMFIALLNNYAQSDDRLRLPDVLCEPFA